jgi:riboflavin transporter FmnP
MNTRIIALTAIFAALAIALNPAISRIAVPAPFFPFLAYTVSEIPIVAVLLLAGYKAGVTAGLISALAALAFGPTYIVVWGTIAVLSMLTGIYLGYRLAARNVAQEKTPSTRKTVLFCTAGAIIFRTVIMAIQNYAILRYPVVGLELPESVIIAIIPPIALFNATQPLYVVPLGYFIAKTINKHLKLDNKI